MSNETQRSRTHADEHCVSFCLPLVSTNLPQIFQSVCDIADGRRAAEWRGVGNSRTFKRIIFSLGLHLYLRSLLIFGIYPSRSVILPKHTKIESSCAPHSVHVRTSNRVSNASEWRMYKVTRDKSWNISLSNVLLCSNYIDYVDCRDRSSRGDIFRYSFKLIFPWT